MRTCLLGLLLLSVSLAFSQAEDHAQLKKILADVLQDSSLSSDIAKINGLPSRLNYTVGNEEKEEIVLNTRLFQKEYLAVDKQPLPATVRDYKVLIKKYERVASFTILLPDGTKASIRAVSFSKNRPWYPRFWHLRGRNLETGGKVRIIRGET